MYLNNSFGNSTPHDKFILLFVTTYQPSDKSVKYAISKDLSDFPGINLKSDKLPSFISTKGQGPENLGFNFEDLSTSSG